MMFHADYHVHTNYTEDAIGNVKDYCEMAKKIGIKEIAFTNHLALQKFESMPEFKEASIMSIRLEDIPKYYKEIEKAREQFDIRIRFGMEVDYEKILESKIERLLDDYPLDFVLGSCHFINGLAITEQGNAAKLFQGINILQIYKKYFDKLKNAIESQLFDVMAHPDVVRKFAVKYSVIPFEKYRKAVENLVSSLVDNNVGIEMNTMGYAHPVRDSYPSLEFLKICKDAGVKIITVGSDTHSPSNLGFSIERGIGKLKKVGYDRVYLFNRRKSKEILL